MKIGILTDPHYSSAPLTCGCRYNSRSLDKLRVCFDYLRENGCETVILLGDITDTEPTHAQELENLRRVAALMDEYPFRIICLMGNHDAFTLTPEEFYGIIGNDRRPHSITLGSGAINSDLCVPHTIALGSGADNAANAPHTTTPGSSGEDNAAYTSHAVTIPGNGAAEASPENACSDNHLVFIDACYFADGRHYAPGDSDWEDTCYPHEAALEKELEALTGDVHVFMHQDIDPLIPENHRLANAANIRRILESSGKVRSVWQGHYHPGHKNTHNGIAYIALPALCENEPMDSIIIHNF